MATISIRITDDAMDAFCLHRKYQATLPDATKPGVTKPNPITKIQFVENAVLAFLRDETRAGKQTQRQESRKQQDAIDDAAIETSITRDVKKDNI